MRQVVLPPIGTVAAWRAEARRLAKAGVPADQVIWQVGGGVGDLFADEATPTGPGRDLRLARAAVDGIEAALCHSDPERFARAYGLVLRLADGTVRWGDRADPAMCKLLEEGKAVARDIHKMHAFVRFRELPSESSRRRFAAWFEPEHPTLERGTPFFANRFGDMDWVIATPTLTATFVAGDLGFAETKDRNAPPEDATEDLWRTYYASIFNAARVMVKAMQTEMPKKYWHNLPEASLIPGLIQGAEARVAEMAARAAVDAPARRTAVARGMAMPEKEGPMPGTLDEIAAEARGCTRCPLYAPATQTVFGEGPHDAALMIVGEQPGDREDLSGRPFVGPAGHLFDEEARAAGLDRSHAYVTNAVKHFKFTPRGKRRIHQRPDRPEIDACRWWLDLERQAIRPKLIVAMGATALQSLTGKGEGILKRRGGMERTADGTPLLVTVHPSYILRVPDLSAQVKAREDFRADLGKAVAFIRDAA